MNPNHPFIDSGRKFVLAVSGGGQEIIGDLTRHGGMSGTLLEAIVPYAPPAFHKLAKGAPDKIVSSEAARALAMSCYRRACGYAGTTEKVFGCASTGAVVRTGGEREGREHRAYIAVQDADRTLVARLSFSPGRTREEEETLVARCVRKMLMYGCHYWADVRTVIGEDDQYCLNSALATTRESSVVNGLVTHTPDGIRPKALFSSSFNPPHSGHLNIIRDASRRLGCPVDLELCVSNADKPDLDYMTIQGRKAAITSIRDSSWGQTETCLGQVVLTNKPLFFDKAALFPGTTFVVGQDTYDRILDERYYPCGGASIANGIMKMTTGGGNFLVYPRLGHEPAPFDPESLVGMLAQQITTFVPCDGVFEASSVSSSAIRKVVSYD